MDIPMKLTSLDDHCYQCFGQCGPLEIGMLKDEAVTDIDSICILSVSDRPSDATLAYPLRGPCMQFSSFYNFPRPS